MLRNNADVRRCSYLSLGYLCFPERKCIFLSLEENLWTINRKKEFPDFDNIKDFPWPWKILVFPWRFPNRGNPGSWLVLACQIHWHLNKKCFFTNVYSLYRYKTNIDNWLYAFKIYFHTEYTASKNICFHAKKHVTVRKRWNGCEI